jgi:predicted acetyltransferase
VLVTCEDSNVGSRTVIEACGGRLGDVVDSAVDGSRVCRYWID